MNRLNNVEQLYIKSAPALRNRTLEYGECSKQVRTHKEISLNLIYISLFQLKKGQRRKV